MGLSITLIHQDPADFTFFHVQVFVDVLSDEELARLSQPLQIDFRFEDTCLWAVIDRIANIIKINITLPPGTVTQ